MQALRDVSDGTQRVSTLRAGIYRLLKRRNASRVRPGSRLAERRAEGQTPGCRCWSADRRHRGIARRPRREARRVGNLANGASDVCSANSRGNVSSRKLVSVPQKQ